MFFLTIYIFFLLEYLEYCLHQITTEGWKYHNPTKKGNASLNEDNDNNQNTLNDKNYQV